MEQPKAKFELEIKIRGNDEREIVASINDCIYKLNEYDFKPFQSTGGRKFIKLDVNPEVTEESFVESIIEYLADKEEAQ